MAVIEMNYCMQCGTKLVMKYLAGEGREIPYCEACKDYRFPVYFLNGYLTGEYHFTDTKTCI